MGYDSVAVERGKRRSQIRTSVEANSHRCWRPRANVIGRQRGEHAHAVMQRRLPMRRADDTVRMSSYISTVVTYHDQLQDQRAAPYRQ
jgi:hypothetical protein